MLGKVLVGSIGALGAWEGAWALRRYARRKHYYKKAYDRAAQLGRPLVVIGDPSGGLTHGYGCGDVCIDLHGCDCSAQITADITQNIPLRDDSSVVYVSCVLEYVDDPASAANEITRVAGSNDNIYVVTVEPWTFTSRMIPGAKWIVNGPPVGDFSFKPIRGLTTGDGSFASTRQRGIIR